MRIHLVEDASVHPDFQHNPFVTGEPGIRFYAGVPLMAGDKEVGAVCLIDYKPNTLSANALRFLEALSYFISDYIYLIDKHVNSQVDWFYKQLGADVGVDTWEWIIPTGEIQFGPTWFYLLGIEPVENKITLSYWKSRVHVDDYEYLKKSVAEHLEGRTAAINNEFRARHINGSWIWFEIHGKAFEYDESGAPLRVTGTSKNITAKKNGELNERKQMCLLNFIIKAQAVFLREKDIKKSCSFIFEELLALADSELGFIGQVVEANDKQKLFIHSLSNVSWCRASDVMYASYEKGELYITSENNVFGKVISAGKFVLMNDYARNANPPGMPPGHPTLRRFLGLPIKVGDEVVGMIGLANKSVDYTEEDVAFFQPLLDTLGTLFYALEMEKSRQSVVEKLRYLAETDVLTNLPNRRAFIEKLSSVGQKSFSPFTIAILDIDFFKAINDEHGHQVGDDVLAEVAHRLSGEIRPNDFIARIGGEEFGLYLSDAIDTFPLDTLCTAVASMPILTSNGLISVSVSIGACHVCQPSQWEDDLRCADHALYQAKKEGRNCVRWHITA